MMKDNAKLWSWTGVVLTVLGLTTALAFQTAFTWGIVESTKFDQGDPALFINSENLNSLQCPLIVTGNEVATVSATFTNPHEIERTRIVRTNISDGFISVRREIATHLSLAPGETQTLTWEVTADDAAWDRLIIVRVFAVRTSALMPSMTGTCSILTFSWLNIPGRYMATMLLVLSVLGPLLGLGLAFNANRPLSGEQQRRMRLGGLLTVIILLGLLISLAGPWIISVTILMIILIILISLALEWVENVGESSVGPSQRS
jgi:hypothetical protein